MAVFNQTSLNYEFVKVRWQEPYVSSAVNRKFFGVFPKGVYSGFVITPVGIASPRMVNVGPGTVSGGLGTGLTGPGYVSGSYDESVGWSIAVHQSTDGHSSTVSIVPGILSNYQFDCTGLEGQRVYLVLDVQYSVSSQTSSRIKLVDSAEIDGNPSVIVLGHIDVPASPATPIDSTDIGYDDPSYPRLTPLSTPTRAGLMPASVWSMLAENLPWQYLCYADRDPMSNYNIQIAPSQKVASNRRYYAYIQANVPSKFPRSASDAYNGGSNNDQLTTINFSSGAIGGAHQVPTNSSITTPSIVGTPNAFQTGIVALDPNDNILVFYSDPQASEAVALLDDNLPVVGKKLFQICCVLFKTDGAGALQPLGVSDISDRRPFLNLGGGAGGDANELLERYKDQLQDSVYEFATPTVFSVDEVALVDTVSSTAFFNIVTGTIDLDPAETLVTNQMLGTEFIAQGSDVGQIDLTVTYIDSSIDTSAAYQVSRDGGLNFQTVSMSRVGNSETFAGTHAFNSAAETNTTAISSNPASLTATESLTPSAVSLSQSFVLTESKVLSQISINLNKTGTPTGSISMRIVRDSSGSPSSDPIDTLVASYPILSSSISAGDSLVSAAVSRTVLKAGTYHVVVDCDSVYQAGWSALNELRVRTATGSALSDLKKLNGSWVSVAGEAIGYSLSGYPLKLVAKVTASSTCKIAGLSVFFGLASGLTQPSYYREAVTIAANSNPSAITLQSFVPQAERLSVYEVQSGKVYVAPFFYVSGQNVVFPAGVFNSSTPISLVFRQEQ